MAKMEWSDNLSVGIPSIDSQHKVLISMINDLSAAMEKGKSKDALEAIFDGIVKYTGTHFANEMKLFETHGYPETVAHRQEHDALVKQALELQAKFKSGNVTLGITTQTFLTEWLKKHIMGTDKKYSQFLIAKGVK